MREVVQKVKRRIEGVNKHKEANISLILESGVNLSYFSNYHPGQRYQMSHFYIDSLVQIQKLTLIDGRISLFRGNEKLSFNALCYLSRFYDKGLESIELDPLLKYHMLVFSGLVRKAEMAQTFIGVFNHFNAKTKTFPKEMETLTALVNSYHTKYAYANIDSEDLALVWAPKEL